MSPQASMSHVEARESFPPPLLPLLFLYLLITLQLPSSHFPFSFLLPSSLFTFLSQIYMSSGLCVRFFFLFLCPLLSLLFAFYFYSSPVYVPSFTYFSLVTSEILSFMSSRCSCLEHCAGSIMPGFHELICQMESCLRKFKV